MNSFRLTICILACSLSFWACNTDNKSQKTSEYRIISIDEKNFAKEKDFSRIIKNIDLITLETVKESQIGRINNIKEYKGYYYILDNDISKSLFIFDKNGRFVKRIHNIGKGPHEYTQLYFFSIDNYSNQLILCAGYKILKYSLLGDFEEEIMLNDIPPVTLEVLDESKYIIRTGGVKDQICLINKQGKLLKKLYTNKGPKAGLFKDFIKYNQKVLYHKLNNDTVYNLSEKGIEPWLYINFKEKKITKEIIDKIEAETWRLHRSVLPPPHIMTDSHFYTESDDFIYFGFTFGYKQTRDRYNLFYAKKTNSIIVFPPGPILDEVLNKKYGFLSSFFLMDMNSKGQFIGQLNTIDLLESFESICNLVKEDFITINGERSIQGIKYINEMSNPIIALYTFRDSF